MSAFTVDDIIAAGRRGVISLASDPRMRHYSADTIALVYHRTIANMAGAGSLENIAARLADDPLLVAVPEEALDAIAAASFEHFARALKTSPSAAQQTAGEDR